MLSFFSTPILNFDGRVGSSPAVEIFGFGITYYALIIVTGMVLAIIIFSLLLKSKNLNPDDSLDYSVFVLPASVLGARIYFFMFPYDGDYISDWANFWSFRDGGLGIYGGVIAGYLVVHIIARIKMANFVQIADLIAPCLLLAQSIGRWGNFVNQEAYGNLITDPNWQWFPAAVKIGENYYQATFFYESFFTMIGFIISICLVTKWKKFPRGFNLAFYGVYYGVLRLVVESFRTDSLYLWIRYGDSAINTGIKISQFVSWCAIIMGTVRYVLIFTKWDVKFDAWLSKITKSPQVFNAKVLAAEKKAANCKKEESDILERLNNNVNDALYVRAKKRTENAEFVAADLKKRRDYYFNDFLERGIDLNNFQKSKSKSNNTNAENSNEHNGKEL